MFIYTSWGNLQASMLEIYNESIRDLLSVSRSNGPDASPATGKQYGIKHDQNGNTVVSDLTVVDVCSIKEVSYLLRRAAQSRCIFLSSSISLIFFS